ncbi:MULTISPECIES: sulfonate ABC transporter substrate-binding protein [Hyphomicrobium]|jgi:sulfonate transport system substrate-binding protein|uniref:sulfonate ABC transporter substrate-binding protein n=1 Tax=Hyphomicrobium TaxID=81 RepID=UPI00037C8CE7|nr:MULTISPECIES: sulfonate ABC transporter substrate-binding protein [Hyphomicrobium]WBT37139.1 sulfonate ABC transporter substrate-binding protein [Hyphomicrobium sp. DMF-1]HML41418.1 sulfonate ABC transporter substrate-binding protein [Hyphomicrobium zavarzinii]
MSFTRRGFGALALGALALGSTALSASAEDKVIRIGYQKYGNVILLKAKGTLEPKLEAIGYKVTWAEFPFGPPLLEAINAGAIDFGHTGEAPPVFAQAAGSAIVYVAHEPPAPGGEAILVPKDSPIKSVAELKGKKVAYAKGSNANYFAVKALEKAGVKYGEFEPVHLAPADARAAFESGKVDAWSIWDPFYASAEATANARVLQDGTGIVSNHQFYLAGKSAVEKHAKAIEVVLAELNAVNEWVRQDPKAAAEQLAPGTGVPAAILETALKRQSYGVKPLDAKVIEEQQKIGDLFHSLGLIPKTIKVDEIVWRAGS